MSSSYPILSPWPLPAVAIGLVAAIAFLLATPGTWPSISPGSACHSPGLTLPLPVPRA